jgi:hypothetical protein
MFLSKRTILFPRLDREVRRLEAEGRQQRGLRGGAGTAARQNYGHLPVNHLQRSINGRHDTQQNDILHNIFERDTRHCDIKNGVSLP